MCADGGHFAAEADRYRHRETIAVVMRPRSPLRDGGGYGPSATAPTPSACWLSPPRGEPTTQV
ncbi:hypothetical protein [Tsukamurella soli]|uniref:hypothetical protein n=1 Tax=Tsukamurella soli TaxID=644556 RepID=UPI0031E6B22A